jgi:hypothetical protein
MAGGEAAVSALTLITIGLSVISVLLLPAVGILIRGAVKWTRTESQLGHLVGDMRELVADKDKVHQEILAQMRDDRAATDRRLRYIEEFWMGEGHRAWISSAPPRHGPRKG